ALAVLRGRGRDVDLVIAGFQAPGERDRLRALAHELGVGDAVEMLGHVSADALAERYARSVTLALSTTEGFGLTPVEAILSDGRVAAVDIPAYRNTVDGLASFASDDSPEAVADAVAVALERPSEAFAVTQLAERFSVEACAASLRAAYEGALG
ncbi:MAG: glycosyltransferase, partial [Candidatus Limnocylindrales bacterium]